MIELLAVSVQRRFTGAAGRADGAAVKTFVRRLTVIKKAIFLLVLMVGAQLAAQDKTTVTVKGAEVNNGVVIVSVLQTATAEQAKASFELHCNKGNSACKSPEPGTYLMVRLPKNWGMYDCANVDLYAASANPDSDQKIGEYCLMEK